MAVVRNKAEPTSSPYTLMGAVLTPFWSGGSLIGAALLELILLLLERRLLFGAEPTPFLERWLFLGADPSFGALLAPPERRLLFGAPLAPL